MKLHQQLFNLARNFFAVKFLAPKISKKEYSSIKKWHSPSRLPVNSEKPIITWIGQSTFLIQLGGINILTDPIFFNLSFLFPRFLPPGISINNIPPIDIIIISHNHNDHMHKKSLLYIKKKHDPIILVPHGTTSWFFKHNFTKIIEHKWRDKYKINNTKIILHFLPSIHWTGTNIFNFNKSICGSWMIEYNNNCFYFAGDSAYSKHFKEIAQTFPIINTALLPIGPIKPEKLLTHAHSSTKNIIQAFLDLNAYRFIPMHWGTFRLGIEKFDEPVKQLEYLWQKNKNLIFNKKLTIPKFGEKIQI